MDCLSLRHSYFCTVHESAEHGIQHKTRDAVHQSPPGDHATKTRLRSAMMALLPLRQQKRALWLLQGDTEQRR